MIFLTGLMGSGKTTVGKMLAASLGWRFVDTDQMVARRAGKSIPKIFASQGEKAFRSLETRALGSIRGDKTVVATGGGIVLSPKNRAWMRRHGIVIYLAASVRRIAARLSAGQLATRPLLKSGAADLAILHKKRVIYYAEAHFKVRASRPAKAVAARIAQVLRKNTAGVLHDKTPR
jgi:shikimate kinase